MTVATTAGRGFKSVDVGVLVSLSLVLLFQQLPCVMARGDSIPNSTDLPNVHRRLQMGPLEAVPNGSTCRECRARQPPFDKG